MDKFSQYIPKNTTGFFNQPYPPTSVVIRRPDLIQGVPDGILSLCVPIVLYWSYSTFFHIVDTYELAEKYRIHPSEEVLQRNKVTLRVVIQDVIVQHIIQTLVGLVFYKLDPVPTTGYEQREMWYLKQRLPPFFKWNDTIANLFVYYGYWYGLSATKIIIAFVIIDTWQFFLHRLMHVNKTLYRKFHSRHHKLYVPYAFGALFNDPFEGFLLDTVGAGLAAIITGLTPRESMVLYGFSTLKTVDDHCGYSLPFDIFQIIFPNDSIYHDIHHQHFGIKSNFSQPFFTFWDKFFGTTFHGVDQYKQSQQKITLERYKEFLASRQKSRIQKQQQQHSKVERYSDSEDEPDHQKKEQ
ncbi:hypothetical protein LJB42_002863 [Komagataella kurtzmanii]|nr:hypothetical protein LJB42_002863 [Komagataella kurtzmanii]